MEKVYLRICIPLMQINSNIYAFLSGVLVSLATNIFTNLCFEKFNLYLQWHQYTSSISFTLSSAICLLISTKIVNFQNYISTKQIIDSNKRQEIIKDVTKSKKDNWILYYMLLLFSLIGGIIMLVLGIIVNN
jgi:hypothetical protein